MLRKKNACLSYTRTREIIQSAFSDFEFNVANFGMHSFRSGGATAATQNDTPKFMIVGNQIKPKMVRFKKVYRNVYLCLRI